MGKIIALVNLNCKHSANTSSRGREALGRGDPKPSGLPRPAKSGGARNDDRILTLNFSLLLNRLHIFKIEILYNSSYRSVYLVFHTIVRRMKNE
jgi:hypothetical protein